MTFFLEENPPENISVCSYLCAIQNTNTDSEVEYSIAFKC